MTPDSINGRAAPKIPSDGENKANGTPFESGFGHEFAGNFWTKVNKTDGCWLWTGAKMENGYGRFRVYPNGITAHRFAWINTNGPIIGLKTVRGEDQPGSILTNKAVVEIRKEYKSAPWGSKKAAAQKTAARFGVALSTVVNVAQGYQWKHI